MKLSEQARRGIIQAISDTGISAWKASVEAGFNQNQVARFIRGRNDMTIGNFEQLCEKGFKLKVRDVLGLGK